MLAGIACGPGTSSATGLQETSNSSAVIDVPFLVHSFWGCIQCMPCLSCGCVLAGRACSLGTSSVTGLQERRNSSGVTDRPPLSPWCKASSRKLSQHQSLTDSKLQVSFETTDDSFHSSACCAQPQISDGQRHSEADTRSQPSGMITDFPYSQVSISNTLLSECRQLSGAMQQQQVPSSHSSHADMGKSKSVEGCYSQHLQALQPPCEAPLHKKSPFLPLPASSAAPHVPASSPMATSMEIDTDQSHCQQRPTAAPVDMFVNGFTDMAQNDLLQSTQILAPERIQDLLPDVAENLLPGLIQHPLPELTEAFSPSCSMAPPQVLCQSPRLGQEQSAEPDRRRSFSPLSRGPASVLPTAENSETGLPSISCTTLAQLLTGQHSFAISSLQMIDCRSDWLFNALLQVLLQCLTADRLIDSLPLLMSADQTALSMRCHKYATLD